MTWKVELDRSWGFATVTTRSGDPRRDPNIIPTRLMVAHHNELQRRPANLPTV